MNFEDIKKYLDEKFAMATNAAQPVLEGTKNLSSKGNQAQYDHGVTVLNILAKAKHALTRDDGDHVKKLLEEGENEIRKRLKLVRLADKSEFGWDAAEE